MVSGSTSATDLISDAQKSTLANTFLDALKRNDWDLMRTLLAKAITWGLPGTSVLSGIASGRDAIINRAKGLKAFGVKFELLHVLYGLNGFTLSLHNTANRSAITLDEYVAIVFELDNGKIARMNTCLSDVAGINQFFAEGII